MNTDLELHGDLEEELIRLFAQVSAPAPPVVWESSLTSPELPVRPRRRRWFRRRAGDRHPRLDKPPKAGAWIAGPTAPYAGARPAPPHVAPDPGPEERRRWTGSRRTRVAISTAAGLAVAAGTFAVLAFSVSRGGHPEATISPSASGKATSSASASPSPPVSPAACLLPVSQDVGTASTGVTEEKYGFLDTATGELRIDAAVPAQPVGTFPGRLDRYLPSLGGWRSLPLGAVISPDGRSYAYIKFAWNPYASPSATSVPVDGGQLHIVDAAGADHALTPSGELDNLIGWATGGVVVARANQTNGGQVYLVNPMSGAEHRLGISPDDVSGDTLWYVRMGTPGQPQSVVAYTIRSGDSTTWFDTQGTAYSVVSVETVDAQGHPVVWVQNGSATRGALLVLTKPNDLSAAQTAWSGPLQQQGYYVVVTDVSVGSGWLWFAVENYRPLASAARTPGNTVLDAMSSQVAALHPSGTGQIAVPLGAGPLGNGSNLSLYWWNVESGAHQVAQLPETGENSISIVGSCIAG